MKHSPEIEERIRKRAYEIYCYHRDMGLTIIVEVLGEERERTAQDDWLEAERQILAGVESDWTQTSIGGQENG